MIENLKLWLREHIENFTEKRFISVGCSTCGDYDEVDVIDMEALDNEIDAFIRTFESKGGN